MPLASRLKARIAASLAYRLKTDQIHSEVSAVGARLHEIEAKLEQAQQNQQAQQTLQIHQTRLVQRVLEARLARVSEQAQEARDAQLSQLSQQGQQAQLALGAILAQQTQQALDAQLAQQAREAQLAQLGQMFLQSQQALQSLQAQLVQMAQMSQQTAKNSDDQVQALRDLVLGLRGEMHLELRRLRLGSQGIGDGGHALAMYLDLLENVLTGAATEDTAQSSVGDQPYDPLRRSLGRDWPTSAMTMIGGARMRNLRNLLEMALQRGIEGDFIETGVWRGGACIYAKAIFDAYSAQMRRVFVADSFRGLPPPNVADYPQDAGDTHHSYAELAISREAVEANFRRFGLLDERVVFIEGWFSETLGTAPVDKLCVLRLDGDLYESTIVALEALYDKVSVGGFVIIDDYLLAPCAQAVKDFRSRRGIVAPMQAVDSAAVWWEVGG